MITVRLYGLLRMESGIRECSLDATGMKEVLAHLTELGISPKELKGCVIFVNGKSADRHRKLQAGDVVQLMSPVAGG